MKMLQVPVTALEKIKPNVYLLSFTSRYIAKRAAPGQFVHIRIAPSVLLRRPFSIHAIKKDSVFVLFRIKGVGTAALTGYGKRDTLDMIAPLGRGFSGLKKPIQYERFILLGGGMGVAPLVFLAQTIKQKLCKKSSPKENMQVVLGVKTKKDLLAIQQFKDMGARVHIATEDGSRGIKGRAPDVVRTLLKRTGTKKVPTMLYACGPKEMFYALKPLLKNNPHVDCEVSFEQFMGCGVGMCFGCSIKTVSGYQRVCKEGPVFNIREILV